MTTTTPRYQPRYHIIREAELDHARQSGHRLRAYCPVHGSDRQRSLDIECEGDAAGWGVCRACGARVFVPELARPDVAARILSGAARGPRPPRPITAADMLRPMRPRAPLAAAPVPIGPELAQLRALDGRMRSRLEDERALTYLAARRIPLEVARAYGVGYIPADARLAPSRPDRGPDLARWRERVMFPLGAPGMDGPGYIGRSLWRWTGAELDELAHKALLDGTPGAPKRWLKTQAPAGWFNYAALAGAETAVIVEGAFDALALLTASVGAPVVALAGTAGHVAWLPPSVRGVVLALDGDTGGQSAAAERARELRDAGVYVVRCAPPDDGLGKDWAARWRVAEWDGLAPLYDALGALDEALDSARTVPAGAPIEADPPSGASIEAALADPLADLWTLARADPVVTLLTAHGYILADVYAVAS